MNDYFAACAAVLRDTMFGMCTLEWLDDTRHPDSLGVHLSSVGLLTGEALQDNNVTRVIGTTRRRHVSQSLSEF